MLLGSNRFLAERGVKAISLAADAERLRRDGATVIFIAVDGDFAGLLGIADPIKGECASGAASATRRRSAHRHAHWRQSRDRRSGGAAAFEFRRSKQKCCLTKKAAWPTSCAAMAAWWPWLETASTTRRRSPPPTSALPWAPGTDVAIESAGITLLQGDLAGLLRARHLSRATMHNIRQNLFFAFIYNGAAIPIAAGILYPSFGVLLSPIIGAAAMALSSVSVIANALRLRSVRL